MGLACHSTMPETWAISITLVRSSTILMANFAPSSLVNIFMGRGGMSVGRRRAIVLSKADSTMARESGESEDPRRKHVRSAETAEVA